MDEKRKVQNLLNHSLSGLKENPFLARRVIAKSKGEEPVAKRISTAMVIVLVLAILTVTAAAAALIWREAGEKIAVMERDNGYYDTWDTNTKVELVRYLAELGELKDSPDTERLLNDTGLSDTEKSALCDRIVTGYMGDSNVEMVTLENLLSVLKGEEGYLYTWPVEDQYWYQELLRKNGILGHDVPHLVLPEEGEITQEEAVRIARELLEKVSDRDLDNGERTQTFEERMGHRIWNIWYDLMTDGEYKGISCWVELAPDGSILEYHIPELGKVDMKGIIPDGNAVSEEQALKIGRNAIAEALGVPKNELPDIRVYYTQRDSGCASIINIPSGQPVWTIDCAEKKTCAILSPDGTQLLYVGRHIR